VSDGSVETAASEYTANWKCRVLSFLFENRKKQDRCMYFVMVLGVVGFFFFPAVRFVLNHLMHLSFCCYCVLFPFVRFVSFGLASFRTDRLFRFYVLTYSSRFAIEVEIYLLPRVASALDFFLLFVVMHCVIYSECLHKC